MIWGNNNCFGLQMSKKPPPPKPVPRKPGEGTRNHIESAENVVMGLAISASCDIEVLPFVTGHVAVVRAVYPYQAQHVSV